ncbi:hypothetical protein TNCT_712081 [Trichonephila clavata]|uniref:Uncharacterized protein n=1 Tax=Trichonephila clavata TaxID=2740835 RepID=A0A8X6GK65_TRICU|nr:hypothetical protein TNCT_712081 [Trichonephila clavata]
MVYPISGSCFIIDFSLHIIFNFTCDEVLWQTRTEWNEVELDGFFTTGMTTQQTAPWENWHLERGFKLLRTFGLVRWGLGGSGHVEGTGEKPSFASQAANSTGARGSLTSMSWLLYQLVYNLTCLVAPGGAWMGSCIAERGALPRPLLVAESGASPTKLVL